MLDWIVCPICTNFPDDKGASPFYIASCGHIACNICIAKGRMETQCFLCKKPVQVKRIDELRGDNRMMFEDPRESAAKLSAEAAKVAKFQEKNRTVLASYEKNKRKEQEKIIRETRQREQALKDELETANKSAYLASNCQGNTRPGPSRLTQASMFSESFFQPHEEQASASELTHKLMPSQRSTVDAAAPVGLMTPASTAGPEETARNSVAAVRWLNDSRSSIGLLTPVSNNSASSARISQASGARSYVRNSGKRSLFDVVPLSSSRSVRSDFGEHEKRRLRDPTSHRITRTVAMPPRASASSKPTRICEQTNRFI